MAGEIRVEEASQMFDGLPEVVERLVRQLSRSSAAPSRPELEEIIGSPACRLLLARDESGAVVGMLTLVLFRIPTGVRARIEDVVVDESARGRGVGEQLSKAAIRLANEHGARTVDLTSRPSREAASGFIAGSVSSSGSRTSTGSRSRPERSPRAPSGRDDD